MSRYCKLCKTLVMLDGKAVNMHCVYDITEKADYICIDCADDYFCDLEIKNYKQWCKDNQKKIDKKVIERIKANNY